MIVGHAHQLTSVGMAHALLEKIVEHVQLIVELAHQLVHPWINMDLCQGASVFLKSLELLENVDVWMENTYIPRMNMQILNAILLQMNGNYHHHLMHSLWEYVANVLRIFQMFQMPTAHFQMIFL
jgi:hypothetical protein